MQSTSAVRVQPGQCQLCLARRALPTSSRRGRLITVSAQVSVAFCDINLWSRMPLPCMLFLQSRAVAFYSYLRHCNKVSFCRKPTASPNVEMRYVRMVTCTTRVTVSSSSSGIFAVRMLNARPVFAGYSQQSRDAAFWGSCCSAAGFRRYHVCHLRTHRIR